MSVRHSRMLRMVALSIAALAAWPGTGAAQLHQLDTAEVRTRATASRAVRPNHATLTLQFGAEGSSPREAGERVASRADTVRRALTALGVPRDSLITGSAWSWWSERIQAIPRERMHSYVQAGHPYVTAALDTVRRAGGEMEFRAIYDTTYRAREIIEVRLSDPTKLGSVIDAALSLNIREISGVHFSATDVRAAYLAALREATALVRQSADTMAAASGHRLGRLLSLSTEQESGGDYAWRGVAVEGTVATVGQTEVTAPSLSVSATVYARWQLLPR